MSESAFKPGDEIGRYRLIERIGSGGQGEVWRARDSRFERDVALKILPPKALADESARERFRREARAVGKLNHPNIATAHDFDTKPVDYLVTEYVSGVGLDRKLAGGPLAESVVTLLGLQLAKGLEAAHREGIVHRDLKPGNLRINQEGTLKILDFGLAEMFDPSKDIASLETITINLTLTGTVPYMAPEQFGGIADQRTDIWSAGAVLYEMATGKLPFTETQIQELRAAIQYRHPAKPRDVNPLISEGLEQVILRCLRKSPDQRYQSATELRGDLERLRLGQKTEIAKKLQGRRFAVAALAVILALSAVSVYHYWPQISRLFGFVPPSPPVVKFNRMAILPIESGDQNPSEDALVRGMAETVTAHLARATQGQKIQLIPPSELISRGAKTSEEARQEFGVERVLEVSVQRSGEKVRVTCSLIDPKTHQILNACTVTGDNNDLFALQDNLVDEVIAMLPADARSPQAEPSEVQAATPAGYENYLKGRGYLLDYQKPENITAAIQEFQKALKASPNYAPPYAAMGVAYWRQFNTTHDQQWLDKAKSTCDKSLAIQPGLAEGHDCLGRVYRARGEYDKAREHNELAVAADPKNTMAVLALAETLDKLNRPADAEKKFQEAIALNPNYWAAYNVAGYFYYGHANYKDAEMMFQKASKLAPGNNMVLENLGAMYLLEDRYQDAIDVLQRSTAVQATVTAYSNLGAAYFYLRKYPESVAALRKASELDAQNYITIGDLADALYWSPATRNEAPDVYRRALNLARASLKVNPNDSGALSCAASYSAMLDDQTQALAAIEEALTISPNDPDVMFRAATVHNHFGHKQQTLEWLRKATQAGFSRSTVRDTPDFTPLHSDPEFAAIVNQSS